MLASPGPWRLGVALHSSAEQVTTDSCGISSQRVDKILFYFIRNNFISINFAILTLALVKSNISDGLILG